jgi:DNA-binding transcriptional regulator YiaG
MNKKAVKKIPRVIDTASIRAKYDKTQEEFEAFTGIALGTIRRWDQYVSFPTSSSRTLLILLDSYPEVGLLLERLHKEGKL